MTSAGAAPPLGSDEPGPLSELNVTDLNTGVISAANERDSVTPTITASTTSLAATPETTTANTRVAPTSSVIDGSLRRNFSWTFVGNVVYSACQAGILMLLAKLGNPEMVGKYGLAMAIATPVLALSSLQLRAVLTTDVKGKGSVRRVSRLPAGDDGAVAAGDYGNRGVFETRFDAGDHHHGYLARHRDAQDKQFIF